MLRLAGKSRHFFIGYQGHEGETSTYWIFEDLKPNSKRMIDSCSFHESLNRPFLISWNNDTLHSFIDTMSRKTGSIILSWNTCFSCFFSVPQIAVCETQSTIQTIHLSVWVHALFRRQLGLRQLLQSVFSVASPDDCLLAEALAEAAQMRMSVCPVLTFCGCHLFLHLQFNV